MNNDLFDFLQSIGLTDTETRLYAEGLGHAQIGVKELVDATGIKRTTVYHSLNTLRQKGLVSESKENGRLVYVMARGDNLKRYLQRKVTQLEQRQSELAQIETLLPRPTKQPNADWKIEHYTGKDGVELAIDTALYCRSKKWRIIAPTDNYFSHSDASAQKYFLRTRANRHIEAQSLWEDTFGLPKSDIEHRHPRVLPSHMTGQFRSTIILFDSSVLMLSSGKSASAVLIHSVELFSTLSVMFDGLYATALPFETKS